MLSWFERRLNPYPTDDLSVPPKSLFGFCLHYMHGLKRWLALMAVLTALIALAEVSLFGFLGNIVDWLGQADKAHFLENEGGRLAAMAVLVVIIMPLLVFFQAQVIHQTLLGNFPQRVRWMLHRYLLRQSMGYFQDEFAGRVAAKLMQTSLAVREVVMKLLDVLNYVIVYFIGAVVLAAANDWRLAIPFLVWVAAYIMLMRHYVPRLQNISAAQADARSLMTGRVVDSYTNIATVKLFSHSRREESYARESMDAFLGTVHGQMRIVTKLFSTLYALNALLLFSVTAIGITLWLQDLASIGALAVAAGLALRFNGMSQWIMWEMSALFENIGTVQDGINSFTLPRAVNDAPDAQPLTGVKGAIAFDHVHFHYGRDGGIIEDLSLSIRAGEKVGLVGRSGAGKSTLVNLLLRFYDLEGGTLTIDGHDISKVTQESLRANIGMVSQDTSLLHRSVRDNIAYGRPDASEADIIAAAENAEAADFIPELSDAKGRKGYDAHVGERGVRLSGGQRQRIAIARVLLKNAPILVLDEATSALDSEAEAAIQSQLDRLMQNKTVIAIAHRLSTIAAMDRLIVLDAGKIVEQGTHAELLEQGGHYAQLWARQSGGFLDLDADEAAAE